MGDVVQLAKFRVTTLRMNTGPGSRRQRRCVSPHRSTCKLHSGRSLRCERRVLQRLIRCCDGREHVAHSSRDNMFQLRHAALSAGVARDLPTPTGQVRSNRSGIHRRDRPRVGAEHDALALNLLLVASGERLELHGNRRPTTEPRRWTESH